MDIEYGVQINTEQGFTDPAMGAISGVIKWQTGSSGMSWGKEGIVSKDSFSPVSQEIEISAGGSYATMSGFSLKIDNTGDLADRIRDLGLNLIQKEIIFYTFRDGVATQDWTGKIGDWSYDETEIQIQCMDGFRGIHRTTTGDKVDDVRFPTASKASKGKPIPIALGYVTKAPLLAVSSEPEDVTLCIINAINWTVAGATVWTPATLSLSLYTKGKSFVADSPFLVGAFLNVVAGGVEQSRRIRSNVATDGGTEITVVVLEEILDVTTAFVAWNIASSSDSVWYFKVSRNSVTLLASSLPIKEFKENSQGDSNIQTYDSGAEAFEDVSRVGLESDVEDIESTGFPGFHVAAKSIESGGAINTYTRIVPSRVSVQAQTNVTNTGPGLAVDYPDLRDQDQSTDYVFSGSSGSSSGNFILNVDLPAGVDLTSFDDVFILLDFTHNVNLLAESILIEATLHTFDLYGRAPTSLSAKTLYNATLGTSPVPFYSLPAAYYGSGTDSEEFFKSKALLSISSILGNINANISYPKISLQLGYAKTAGNTYVMTLKEVGFVGKNAVNFGSEPVYSDLMGEVYQSTWGSRRTAGDAITNPADAIEHLIREYDGHPEAIDTSSFNALGDPTTGAKRAWSIGRQISEEANTFDLCRDLARFGFFGIIPRNDGTRAVKEWMGVNPGATHDMSVINTGTIGAHAPTSLANLYNDIEIRYAWNSGSQKYDKFFKVTRIDEDEFPAQATLDGSGNPEWKSFAIGFTDAQYATAAGAWAKLHLSWEKYGLIQKLPDELANCKWFPDVETEWGLTAANNAALLYLLEGVEWWPFRKEVVPYQLPNTADNAALELLDAVIFNDGLESTDLDPEAGAEVGWIVRKAIVPGLEKDYIEISLMLEPDTE
jgi:hypothetical protein